MDIAMHNWMRAEPVETTLRRLQKYGYDGIEISYDSVALVPNAIGVAATRRLLQEYNLRCVGSISLMFTGRDLLHPDNLVRERSVEYLKQCVQMVHDLDGRTMNIVPSEVGKTRALASPEAEWKWAVEGLRELYSFAQSRDVRLAIEPINRFETNFINRHDQALALANEIGSDVGVCLDIYHMNMEDADMFQAIRNAGSRLYDLHVADNNRLACGMGSIDWARVIATCKEIGYDGSLTVEFVPSIDRTPVNPFKQASENDDSNINQDHLKFIEDHGSGIVSGELYDSMVAESIKTLRQYL